MGLPGVSGGKESTCQSRRHRFNTWVGKIPWRREWLPTLVFLPGEFHGQRSLVGYRPWCHKGLDMAIPGLGSSPGEAIGYPLQYSWASLVAQMVKNPPAMLETWIPSLGWEDLLEKGKATHSSILAWRIPWTETPGGLQSTWLQRVGHDGSN